MANEIVRYHNDLSQLRLKNFTAVDMDIFITLCYECKERGTKDVWISYKEMKQLMNYTSRNKQRFMGALKDTSKKLHALSFEQKGDNGNFRLFHFFEVFETVEDDAWGGFLHVKVAEEFVYLLNQLDLAQYTAFELKKFVNLKSTYAKSAMRTLMRFKHSGWWRVSLADFKNILDIPDSYSSGMINTRIITRIKEELDPLFKNLQIEPIYIPVRGGKQLWGYSFEFEREKRKGIKGANNNAEITSMLCPECGQPLYKLQNSEGKKFYGHIDGWMDTAVCKKTYSSKFEAMGNSELPDREHPNNYDY